MSTAFVFVQVGDAQNIEDMHKRLHAVSGAKGVYFLAGPTDVLIQVEYEDLQGLANVDRAIRAVQGVASTDTRVVLPI